MDELNTVTAGDTQIDLLRHGEPVGGMRYRGQLDDALSEKGWQQMWRTVEGMSDWQQIVTSPLLRCSSFAEALGERLHVPVHEESRFREVGFGEWEGYTRLELEVFNPGQVARFLQDPVNSRPPGAEPLEEFTRRVQAGFDDLLDRFAGQSVLVVAHAGVIRAIMAYILDVPPSRMYRIHVANAALSRIRTDKERQYYLVRHGLM
jgi:alpha-ribazole phosphatase